MVLLCKILVGLYDLNRTDLCIASEEYYREMLFQQQQRQRQRQRQSTAIQQNLGEWKETGGTAAAATTIT